MRRIATLLLFLLIGIPAFAGTSAVTATITDSDSQTWNNGTFQVSFVPTPGVPASAYNVNGVPFTQSFSGTMNGSGVLTVTLTDLSTVSPTGGQWRFTLCPNASASCTQVVTSAVVGATPNLSSQLSLGLAGPRFAASAFAFGYLDVEVSPIPSPGSQYFNVTSGTVRLWNGSVWAGAGTSPGLSTLGPSFNVAVNYGCKPDATTDNSTCITSAFAASNAVTSGIPTVYFPCTPGTGCQYNINAGAGISPFNPLIPTTIKCDPGVALNFTSGSTAHAMDLGPTNLTGSTYQAVAGYTISGCRFLGGANLTEGIYINPFIANVEIAGPSFYNFGNGTATMAAIWAQSENWSLRVHDVYWWTDDAVLHNFLKINNASANLDNEFYIGPNNTVICTATPTNSAVKNCGFGLWVDGIGVISANNIAGPVPAVRLSSHSTGTHIYDNIFEVDPIDLTGGKTGIEYGNPSSSDTVAGVEVNGNTVYVGAATDFFIHENNINNVANQWFVHHNFLRSGSLGTTLMHETTLGTNLVRDNYGSWTAPQRSGSAGLSASGTGFGTGAGISVNVGSNEQFGAIVITTGTSAAASGTATLTFSDQPYTTSYSCLFQPQNGGQSWNAQAAIVSTGGTATTRTLNWSNNAVALTSSSANAYVINYQCGGF